MEIPICIPVELLRVLLDMANSQMEDLESGVEQGIYSADENSDIPEKKRAIASVEELLAREENGPLWIVHLPVLTTAHLQQETGEMLLSKQMPWLQVAQYEEGFFLKIDKRPDLFGEQPDDLNKVIEWAISQKFDWIRFDRDGDTVEGLAVFDW